MEVRTVLAHCLRIFCHLFVQVFHAGIIESVDSVHRAQAQATTTAHAFVDIDSCLAIGNAGCAMSTNLDAATAANTFLLINLGLAIVMHFHFASTRATAHAQILNSTAKASHFVSLKVRQGNDNIGIHNSAANLRFLHKLSIFNRHISLISALKAIGNNHMATSRKGTKAVFESRIHMLQRMLATAHI